MKLGIIGLGRMGRPIAHNLHKGGAALTVCDHTDRLFAEFRAKGAAASIEPADLADCDVLFLCLPDAEAVRTVLFGDSGLARSLAPGRTVVDLSTIGHGATIEIGEGLAALGVDFLDAPVSGMEARAIEGTLTVMCGGKEETFARVRPLLERIGDKILHMGATGAGQLAKLINQLLFDINCAAIAEILPMAARLGLDPAHIAEIVNSGTGRSYASEFFLPRILRGHFTDGYPMRDAYKDLVSGAEISARQGVPMPVLAAATATYQSALLRGFGQQDKGAMIRVFEELLGIEFRGKEET